ncbi:hypothetical protein FACS1894130_09210 [Spirochaetia bacterium]|nr:hypothetical protein FACS1894130_09210 [Spirochaetia bacterium]
MKYLLLIFIILSPLKIHSQSLLEEGDIVIYINGYGDIANTFEIFSNSNDTWEKYNNLGEELRDNFDKLISGNINDNEFIYLKKLYQNFLNYNPPNEIDNVLKSIGWKVDGHKKLWTIFFYIYLMNEYFQGDEVFDLFNKQDIKLMNRYKEEIKEFFGEYYK